MTLRIRLALATIAIAVPVFAVLYWVSTAMLEREGEAMLGEMITERMRFLRDACEASPATWRETLFARPEGPPRPFRALEKRGPGPGHPKMRPPPRHFRRPPPEVELFAYDATFSNSSTRAPAIDPELREDIGTSAPVASRRSDDRSELLVRMPWGDGPCAFVLARRTGPDPDPRAPPPLLPLLVILAVVMAAFLITLGPVVRLLEQRERTLREFLENTTHDVNTPLTVLLGHLRALQDRLSKSGSADREEAVITASALREAHYMASLMHNLAVAAKLESGQPAVRRDPVDLSAVVERAVARHQPIAGRTGVALDRAVPEEPVMTRGDVTFIEQAVSNLIDNAVRHNKSGGHVAVVLEREGDTFSLRVIDDGPGIPEEEMSRVLDRNFRGNRARTRGSSGTSGQGLGLDIALRVADRHGFALELKPSEMGGLEIELRGPMA